MPDSFQLFVPRIVSEPVRVENAAAQPVVEARQAPPARDPEPDEPPVEDTCERVESPKAPPFETFVQAALEEHERASQVRAEAVRIACIATGRILRHAVAFDPAVILRFVEDAMSATHDRTAVARVHPEHAKVLAAGGIGCRTDDRLQLGEVVIEMPNGCIGARLDERAALIVRSIADG